MPEGMMYKNTEVLTFFPVVLLFHYFYSLIDFI